MKVQKQDRRSLRTHHLLEEALISLLQERRYVDLTVQDIIDRANVGRATFYSHYWDKDDLLASNLERMVEATYAEMPTAPEGEGELLPSLRLFEHVYGRVHLYRALVRGEGLELVMRVLRTRLSEQVEKALRATNPPSHSGVSIVVTTQLVVGAFLALLQWWLENEVPLTPSQIDRYFTQFVLPGARATLTAS